MSSSRFTKGHVPWNKGKKMNKPAWNKGKKMPDEITKKCERTMFKKGCVPHNTRKIGAERITDNYVAIKIGEPNKWKLKHRYLYEKYHNVKLTSQDIIIFADGDTFNFNEDNLIKISRKELLELTRQKLYKRDKDLTATGVNLVKLILAIREKEQKK